MLHLRGRKGFRQGVGNHVVGWAINEVQGAVLDHPPYEVVADVDMFRASVVLVILCERDGGLIIGEEIRWCIDRLEDLTNKAS